MPIRDDDDDDDGVVQCRHMLLLCARARAHTVCCASEITAISPRIPSIPVDRFLRASLILFFVSLSLSLFVEDPPLPSSLFVKRVVQRPPISRRDFAYIHNSVCENIARTFTAKNRPKFSSARATARNHSPCEIAVVTRFRRAIYPRRQFKPRILASTLTRE